MALNKDQEALFRKSMEEAKNQFEDIDSEMEKLVQETRGKLADLQESKRSLTQIYMSSAQLLGIKVDPEEFNNSEDSDENEQAEQEIPDADEAAQDQPS